MMRWRKWNNAIHRDLGYLCFGLTIIYVISGIAVNHIHQWNPTYKIERLQTQIELAEPLPADDQALATTILSLIDEQGALKSIFRVDQDTLKIFAEGNNITYRAATGLVLQERSTKRPVLYQANFLHLNHPKKLWTWFADLYAAALGLLAITGLFILRGSKGLRGRGKWLVCAGIAIPLLFLVLYT